MVVDEQHKFGVGQREALKEKGPQADILVMSATPIPRSLALTVYGDMDITLLKGKPLERKGFLTYWVNEEKRKEVYAFMREEIEKGRQCFVVCPRVRKKEEGDRFSVESMYGVLKDEVFRDKKVACIHGQVKTDEKDDIMKDFRAKKYDILVATTVVEVGVDIPNASVMVVEEASRYGLAQLHQLRGRIGRGEHQSYCILIGDPVTEVSGERLSVISEIDDGFLIAEKDLDIRGPGEFFGTRQSGLPELKVGDIIKDLGIMEEARHEAFELVKADPSLADPRHLGLKRSIIERFRGKVRI
jgi:ATP-dependent DNA helicase RecG